MYERRIEDIHERNKDRPKLKLFSPYKRKSHLHDVEEKYNWSIEVPYNTGLAINALDNEVMDEDMKNEHMALLKNFRKKLE